MTFKEYVYGVYVENIPHVNFNFRFKNGVLRDYTNARSKSPKGFEVNNKITVNKMIERLCESFDITEENLIKELKSAHKGNIEYDMFVHNYNVLTPIAFEESKLSGMFGYISLRKLENNGVVAQYGCAWGHKPVKAKELVESYLTETGEGFYKTLISYKNGAIISSITTKLG